MADAHDREIAELKARLAALETSPTTDPPAATAGHNTFASLPSYHDPGTATTSAPTRRVGFLFGVGIFFLPIIFVWFLLRSGYSTLSRVIGFGWFGLLCLAAISNGAGSPETSQAPTTAPAANAIAPIAPHVDPSVAAFKKQAAALCVADDVQDKLNHGNYSLLPADRLVNLIANDCGASDDDNLLIQAGLSPEDAKGAYKYLAARELNRATGGDTDAGHSN